MGMFLSLIRAQVLQTDEYHSLRGKGTGSVLHKNVISALPSPLPFVSRRYHLRTLGDK